MKDPREVVAEGGLSGLQITVIALCVALNALDGFDVLSISFASPGIAAEWGVDRAALGIILSMELIGMAVGSILLGTIADKVGRRPMILFCLVVMASGMALASRSGTIEELSAYRFYTGLGIGGMLAATNAMVAEFANRKRKALAVILMATGYPLGAIFGGMIASELLASMDWRAVFLFGAIATVIFLPLVWVSMPESVEYLATRQPKGALAKINRTLGRMGKETVDALPATPGKDTAGQHQGTSLFSKTMWRITALLTVAYFTHIMTFYFILKWIPKIVVDMGYAASTAGSVLVWANVGGASGALLLGLLSQKIGVRWLTMVVMLLAAGMVVYFGQGQADLTKLAMVAAGAGFFTNAAVVGLYAIFADAFPTSLRASGTGFAIGVGRGGAALSPIIAGFLFSAGYGLQAVAIIMGMGSVIAAIALVMLGGAMRRQAA